MGWFKKDEDVKELWDAIYDLSKRLEKIEEETKWGSDDSWFSTVVTKEKYIENGLEPLNKKIKVLEEGIKALCHFVKDDYILISSDESTKFDGKWKDPEESREIARQREYSYMTTFDTLGEFWVKAKNKEIK